jgi:hypothetical protein
MIKSVMMYGWSVHVTFSSENLREGSRFGTEA